MCFVIDKHRYPNFCSVLLSYHCSSLSTTSDPSPVFVCFPPFRHRSAHCDRVCPPLTNCLRLPDRPMSTSFLECWLPGNGWAYRYGFRPHGGHYRDVLCHKGSWPCSWERLGYHTRRIQRSLITGWKGRNNRTSAAERASETFPSRLTQG